MKATDFNFIFSNLRNVHSEWKECFPLSFFSFFLTADIINSVEMRNVKSYMEVVAFYGWGVVTS